MVLVLVPVCEAAAHAQGGLVLAAAALALDVQGHRVHVVPSKQCPGRGEFTALDCDGGPIWPGDPASGGLDQLLSKQQLLALCYSYFHTFGSIKE